MGRHKKIITKNVYIKCRVEPLLKEEHIFFCKKRKINPTTHIREFIIKELQNDKKI